MIFYFVIAIVILLFVLYFKNNKLKTAESKCKKLTEEITTLRIDVKQAQLETLKLKKSFIETQKSIQSDFKQIENSNSDAFTYVASLMSDYLTYSIYKVESSLQYSSKRHERERAAHIRDIRIETESIIRKLKMSQYQIEYLLMIHPELKSEMYGYHSDGLVKRVEDEINKRVTFEQQALNKKYNEEKQILMDCVESSKKKMASEQEAFINASASNMTAIPYMAAIMADFETYGMEILAKQLDWGRSLERAKKVTAIREIRSTAKQMIEKNLEAKYQLAYLLELFPNLEDVLETDYKELPIIDIETISEYDRTRDWLSKEEYQNLSNVERNQLALDRYKLSHNKSKWQIGRDYEIFVGYKYAQKGYDIDYFGSYMGLEDLGRDLIAKKDNTVLIIQCKYWGQEKQIHEKHITQLYGTVASYCIENSLNKKFVKGILVTNIQLSEMAKKMAKFLKIEYVENYEKGDYPCIKCNIGHNDFGETRIYHLPFDQQYDTTKIVEEGEFYAMTVQEAENAGFRRAFKWFGK